VDVEGGNGLPFQQIVRPRLHFVFLTRKKMQPRRRPESGLFKENNRREPLGAPPTNLNLTEKTKTTRKNIKISPMKTSSLISAVAAILSLAGYASAGTLTLDPGNPVFTPPDAFNPNTIVANVINNDIVRISGAATITPPPTNVTTVDISGTYSADVGDTFSAAYFFTADLNTANPIQYTISGTVVDQLLGTIQAAPALAWWRSMMSIPALTGPWPISAPVVLLISIRMS
jgi:hypothetical protein